MTRLKQAQINMVQHGTMSQATKQITLKADKKVNLTNSDLDGYQKEKIKDLIQKFPDVFNERPRKTKRVQHQINLVPNAQPG